MEKRVRKLCQGCQLPISVRVNGSPDRVEAFSGEVELRCSLCNGGQLGIMLPDDDPTDPQRRRPDRPNGE